MSCSFGQACIAALAPSLSITSLPRIHLCLIPAQEGDAMMATWKLNSTWRCRETP